jgi:hypothetical protein
VWTGLTSLKRNGALEGQKGEVAIR